jgi:hypothetical protein
MIAVFVLLGASCLSGGELQLGIGGGLQPGIGVSRSGEDLFVHIAPCLLTSVEEVTLSEHQGGSRTAVGLPIHWQIRRMEGAPDPSSKIRAGETPDGFVATVLFPRPPVRPNARYNVLIDLESPKSVRCRSSYKSSRAEVMFHRMDGSTMANIEG